MNNLTLKKIFIYLTFYIVHLFPSFRNSFRIITLHHIPKKHFEKLYSSLKELKREWNFIDPNELNEKKKKFRGKNILLTFDDGFSSQLEFSKKYLKKLNIKAVFFIISDFANIKKPELANKFIKKNIKINDIIIDSSKSLPNITWRKIKGLIDDGHFIGCHSKTHIKLTECKSDKKLFDEILMSKKIIEKKIKSRINFFAYPFGDYKSINRKILQKLKYTYQFIFSGLRGDNINNNDFLMRDAIEPDMDINEIKFYLRGLIDIKYINKFKKLN